MIIIVAGLYYKHTYVGLVTPNAMDIAQVSRNVSEGRGFTTRFVRPFNTVFLEDAAICPELNHGPVYPYVVAAFYKFRSPSDQVSIWVSLLFFLMSGAAVYLLGRLLFDWRIGLLAMGIFSLSRPILKAAMSGEEWTFCILMVTLLVYVLALHHRSTIVGRSRLGGMAYPVLASVLVALLYMTNHVFIFLAIPTAVYFGVTGAQRKPHLIAFLLACVVLAAPWALRNARITGYPVIGVTGWDIMADTTSYPGYEFYRSAGSANKSISEPILFPVNSFGAFAEKLTKGCADSSGVAVSMLGWLAASFAFVSVLYRFKGASANAVRGFSYGALPLMGICFAVFGVDKQAMMVFAPIMAVLSSAYFVLLLEAKKLHPFFNKWLVGGLVFITAFPVLSSAFWGDKQNLPEGISTLNMLFTNPRFCQDAVKTPIYTDIPWALALRTNGVGVWLPKTDDDIDELSIKSLPLNIIVLTPECEKYPQQEIWYVLHNVRLWREYVVNPEEGLREILKAAGLTGEKAKGADKILGRLSRQFRVSDSVKGFMALGMDPLSPDFVQVLVRKE